MERPRAMAATGVGTMARRQVAGDGRDEREDDAAQQEERESKKATHGDEASAAMPLGSAHALVVGGGRWRRLGDASSRARV